MPIREILDGRCETGVSVRGWVYRKRESKEMIFLLVRDSTGFIQCTIKKGSSAWSEAERVTIESSLALEGIAKPDNRAPGGYEIAVDAISIIGLAEVFPIAKDKSEEFLRDVRHLWLRSRKMNTIMKIRSEVMKYIHEFFDKQGFVEVSPPMFISSAVEGGAGGAQDGPGRCQGLSAPAEVSLRLECDRRGQAQNPPGSGSGAGSIFEENPRLRRGDGCSFADSGSSSRVLQYPHHKIPLPALE
jgi:hypothetical protein